MTIPTIAVNWSRAYRLIRSIYPPIDLFEDIADPADWEALASAEAKTNPRIWEHLGRLDLVPPERRVAGAGASLLMAPFTHVSFDRPGRFTDGSYGVYSAGDSEEVAIREVAHHHAIFMRASNEPPGWTAQFRMLVNAIVADLHDVRALSECHAPDNYAPSQAIGRDLRRSGSNGVLYLSVRCPGGECVGVFWPDTLSMPHQSDHFEMHFDGERVDRVRNCATRTIYAL